VNADVSDKVQAWTARHKSGPEDPRRPRPPRARADQACQQAVPAAVGLTRRIAPPAGAGAEARP